MCGCRGVCVGGVGGVWGVCGGGVVGCACVGGV